MSRARLAALLSPLLLAAAGCTGADIQRRTADDAPVRDDKLALSGRVCTTDPADVLFPLKVLFIIDTSQSMNVNDPVSTTEPDPTRQTGRARAIRDVVARFVDLKASYLPRGCNTGASGCEKGSTRFAACGAPGSAMCIGPDCCRGTRAQCKGVPICRTSVNNGTCARLCDVKKKGCRPGESDCPDCPDKGDRCTGGICGRTKTPGVEFAIMRFGSAKQVLTRNRKGQPGFTSDVKELVTAIPQVSNGGSVTDYEGALAKAFEVLDSDVRELKEANAAAVSRARYLVVFLSDGEPYPPIASSEDWKRVPCYVQAEMLGVPLSDPTNCAKDSRLAALRRTIREYNIPARILRQVGKIVGLKAIWGLGDIKVHTGFLAGKNPSYVEARATALLRQMATTGGGTFRSFPNGEAINFLPIGFSQLRRVFQMKSLIAENRNARPSPRGPLADSDGDGLDDGLERLAGTSATRADSDGDGFSDGLEHAFRTSGWDPLDPSDADCPLLADADKDGRPDDSDGDGLLDCEERFLGTSRNRFDSDADGLPDPLEVRFGTNAVTADATRDLDFDGLDNGSEIRLHSDPRRDDAARRARTSYRYRLTRSGTGVEERGLACIADADCPGKGSCREGFCRCKADGDCASGAACKKDGDCARAGERCEAGRCRSAWRCKAPLAGLKEGSRVCAAKKYVTCYDYRVENISLVGTRGRGGKGGGWNDLYLYFTEAPFDDPRAFGNHKLACVRAWYDPRTGAKRPVTGRLAVPPGAWHDPRDFTRTYAAGASAAGGVACGKDRAGKPLRCRPGDRCASARNARCRASLCVCPDGRAGGCQGG